MRNQQLDIKISDGLLTITIGIETMCSATEYGLEHTYGDVTITNIDAFSDAVLQELKCEEEDGATLVNQMIDKAASNAIENGAEGVDIEDA